MNRKFSLMLIIASSLALGFMWTISSYGNPDMNQEKANISIGIVGDSIAIGAGANPNLPYDSVGLWEIMTNKNTTTKPNSWENRLQPLIAAKTIREYSNPLEWIVGNLIKMVSDTYLNSPEASWGYHLAAKKNIPSDQVIFAAQNGAKVAAMKVQIERILAANNGEVPPEIFVHFTGNDLCSLGYNTLTTKLEYGRKIKAGMRYLLQGKLPKSGSTVYIMSPLGAVQIMTKPSILDLEVEAFGRKTTCRELRNSNYEPEWRQSRTTEIPAQWAFFGHLMPPNPNKFCKTLVGPESFVNPNLTTLGSQIRVYRKILKKQVKKINKHLKRKDIADLKFVYLDVGENVSLEGEDMAHDCMHLNEHGQKKIAAATQKSIKAFSEGQKTAAEK